MNYKQWKSTLYNPNQKAVVVMCISDKVDFKVKTLPK